jgi:putative transposase
VSVKRYDIGTQARFLTFSCFRRLPLLGDCASRDAYVRELEYQRGRLGFDVLAYVVMPEHVHLLVAPVDGKVGPVLRAVKQGFARSMLDRMRDEGHPVLSELVGPHGKLLFWQRGGGHDRNVRDLDEIRAKVRYCHFNPVKRGLVKREEDWMWSSVRDYGGERGVVDVRRSW